MNNRQQWDQWYREGNTPWDTGKPSGELIRVLDEMAFSPVSFEDGRVLEIGCGTGASAIYLARKGYNVTAIDISSVAIEKAKLRAEKEDVRIQFQLVDLLDPPTLPAPFPFVFDRGLFHTLRQQDLGSTLSVLKHLVGERGYYLVLAGNASDSAPLVRGFERLHAHELCEELHPLFEPMYIRRFRFELDQPGDTGPLGWSALFRRRNQ